MRHTVRLVLCSLFLSCGAAAGTADLPSTRQEHPTAACPIISLVPIPEDLKWTVQRDLLPKSYPDSIEGYCNLIRDTISLNWNPWDAPPVQTRDWVNAFVSFTIDRSGNLGDVIGVETSPGHSDFAESAIAAIRRSAPFPPVPPHVAENTLRLSVEFDATVKQERPLR
jgi:TonB family protein